VAVGLEGSANFARGIRLAAIAFGLLVALGSVWTFGARGWATGTHFNTSGHLGNPYSYTSFPASQLPQPYVVFQPMPGSPLGATGSADVWVACDLSAKCTATGVVAGRHQTVSFYPAPTASSPIHRPE
jgi:hypothetical protein